MTRETIEARDGQNRQAPRVAVADTRFVVTWIASMNGDLGRCCI